MKSHLRLLRQAIKNVFLPPKQFLLRRSERTLGQANSQRFRILGK
jgi:hypothetical protein